MSAVFIPKKENAAADKGSWFESLDGTQYFPQGIKTLLCCSECGTGNIKIDITEELVLIVTCLECGREMHYGE